MLKTPIFIFNSNKTNLLFTQKHQEKNKSKISHISFLGLLVRLKYVEAHNQMSSTKGLSKTGADLGKTIQARLHLLNDSIL